MSVEEKLAQAGYPLPEAVAPGGSYVPALRVGDLVYTSGQLPMAGGVLAERYKGKVGGGVDLETARDAAARCAVNALAAIKSVLGDLERVERVVKPEVMNAASDLLQQVFGEAGRHVRSAVGMAVLPRDTCVEVELIVQARESSGEAAA